MMWLAAAVIREAVCMSALRQVSLFFRRLFRGSDKALAASLRRAGHAFSRLFQGVWSWGRRRRWGYLAQGLPALAALVSVTFIGGIWLSLPAHEIEARYQDRASAAAKAKDFSSALVCYERLAALGKDRPDNLCQLAIALANQGEPERAFEIMDQLAPLDHAGHGPAHLWLAVYYYGDLGDPKNRKRAETHLKSALQVGLPGTDADAAHGLLGELYANAGQFEAAEPHLERAVKSRPHVRLRYAQVLAAQKKKARAADEAKLAANYFKTRAQADITDQIARIGWAEAAAFLEDFPQALAILAEGNNLTGDAAYRTAMASLLSAWHFHVLRTQPDEVATQWNLLEKGLQLDPTNGRLLNRLVQLMSGDKDAAAKAREVMHKVLVKGEATATTHFLLGMDAWTQGQVEQARIHWERANELSPTLPMVANNLAWLLANAKNPDLPRALELSQRAVAKLPQDPSYHDTRARVYMKMERWRDALADLEWILVRQPNFPGLHVALAEVYDQLRMPGPAAEHRRAAQEQQKSKKKAA
jgi:tetratricopeptide (TPR) repeat protein